VIPVEGARSDSRRSPGNWWWFLPHYAIPSGRCERCLYRVSEQTELRSSIEIEHLDLAKREADLADEKLTRLAWHFGLENFDP
jgi:hypothetical protein